MSHQREREKLLRFVLGLKLLFLLEPLEFAFRFVFLFLEEIPGTLPRGSCGPSRIPQCGGKKGDFVAEGGLNSLL